MRGHLHRIKYIPHTGKSSLMPGINIMREIMLRQPKTVQTIGLFNHY